MSFKYRTGFDVTPPRSSSWTKRARSQLVSVRRALDYATNPCRMIIVYEGANELQMLFSEHVFITKLWICHMIRYMYPHMTESQIDDILMKLNAKRTNLHAYFDRSLCITLTDDDPHMHAMISCNPPALHDLSAQCN